MGQRAESSRPDAATGSDTTPESPMVRYEEETMMVIPSPVSSGYAANRTGSVFSDRDTVDHSNVAMVEGGEP